MATSLMPSYLSNVVANRDRLSAIRQRIGLEPSANQMRELAPSPPNGPKQVTSPATAAVQATPNFDNLQIAPDKRQLMLTQAAEFLNQFKQQPPASAAAPVQAPPPANGRQTQIVRDQSTARAMAPLAAFFKERGRLPNPNELRAMAAARQLEVQLGRKPSDTEVQLFLTKPPK